MNYSDTIDIAFGRTWRGMMRGWCSGDVLVWKAGGQEEGSSKYL